MTISLVLLAAFLYFYLVSVYNTKKADLTRETGYLLENAFKTAENQLLDRMILELRASSWHHKDSTNTQVKIINHKAGFLTMDTFVTEHKMMGMAHTSEAYILESHDTQGLNKNSLKLRIAFQSDSFCLDTNLSGSSGNVRELVENIFKSKLQHSNLNISYRITSDSTMSGKKDKLSFLDAFSGQKYFLEPGDNQAYLLRLMLPEIALSVLLFIAVGFAFYHMIKAYRKRQEIFAMKEDFMRNMTHELKTPIATIGVSLEALQNFPAGKDESLRQEYFRIAENENRKLNLLVEKVLNISQTMDDSVGIPEPTDLVALVAEVIDNFQMRAEHNSVQISFKNHFNSGLIRINPQLVVMALHNLMDNAIKYIKHDNPRVHVQLSQGTQEVNISVSDNGQPIAPEFRDKIFEKFYRIPQGDVHDVKGHGLGLYIVSQLVKILGGRISLKVSEAGNEFILSIPKN